MVLYQFYNHLIIFDSNGFHRLRNFAGSDRLALKFEVGVGVRTELNYQAIVNSLEGSGANLDKLDEPFKNMIKGLFPQGLTYDFDGSSYSKAARIY